jgi:hypothetical protein
MSGSVDVAYAAGRFCNKQPEAKRHKLKPLELALRAALPGMWIGVRAYVHKITCNKKGIPVLHHICGGQDSLSNYPWRW